MKYSPISLLRGTTCLSEGPCWRPDELALYWTDIDTGKIWRFDPASARAEVFHTGNKTGGMTLQHDGSWLLFREDDVAWVDAKGHLKACQPIIFPEAQRFNDVIADPAGRIFAGTIGTDNNLGGLYRFEPNGDYQRLFRGTHISNGMAFSPCGNFLYWTCTTSRAIYRFDYSLKSGRLSERTCIYECPPEEQLPDGLTVDLLGNLWSARWGSGLVVIISPAGKKLGQIEFPEACITSLAWGGEELGDLYVTAARAYGNPGTHDLFVVPSAGRGKAENRSSLFTNKLADQTLRPPTAKTSC